MPDSARERRVTAAPDAGHFEFGRNWQRFLSTRAEERLRDAEKSRLLLLGRSDLNGLTFLDAGSGSGLFSLAAHRLGADVTSFDLDAESVACTTELRARYASDTDRWEILTGSVADNVFLKELGHFDIVYCWGVLHHSGVMWEALENLLGCVGSAGTLALAIYNDQGYISRIWTGVKRGYRRLPVPLRIPYVAVVGGALFLKRAGITSGAALLRTVALRNPVAPFSNWVAESRGRGMHPWYDLVDWVGGWPFEVARPEEVFRFLRDRGFVLRELTTSGGHGCNEFVFVRSYS